MDQDYLKRRVTIYQVSKESGYSLATVSSYSFSCY